MTAPLYGVERLVSADPQGITLDYTPSFDAPDALQDGSLRLRLNDGDLIRIAGRPLTPVRFLTVAVPPGSRPSVRLVSRSAGASIPGRLAVEPATGNQTLAAAELPAADRLIGDIETRSLAGLQIIRIPVYPARETPGGIELEGTMRLRVDFNAPFQVSAGSPTARLTPFQRALILNPEQTTGWSRWKTSEFRLAGWPSGFLYRFPIAEENLYRIGFEQLKAGGVDIPAAGIPSRQIRLFGNSGLELPNNPEDSAPAGIEECAIFMQDGGDGVFGVGDWFAFYGRGAGGWVTQTEGPRYQLHHWDVRNYYWISVDPAGDGKRTGGFAADLPPTRTFETASAMIHHEPERFIYGGASFAGSGREWYGYSFDGPSRVSYTLSAPSLFAAAGATFRTSIQIVGAGPDPFFNLKINNSQVGSFRPDDVRQFAIDSSALRSGYNTVLFEQTSTTGAQSYFDWLELLFTTRLDRPQIFGTNITGGPALYQSSGIANAAFFDVTDHNDVKFESGSSVVVANIPGHRRLILADLDRITPVSGSFEPYFPPDDDIPDILSRSNRADALLIAPDAFYDALQPLVELYSRRSPSLKAVRIRLSEIYNRFGGGVQDIAAIRNFLHYANDYWATPPGYVLFCGDGDYDVRGITRAQPPYFLPTFQGGYNLGSLSSDDWFVDFTPGGRDLLPEIPTGRLTAQTRGELEAIISKIAQYEEEPLFGLWRTRVALVADDEYSETSSVEEEHVRFSEDIALNILPGSLDKVKIYLTEYQRQWGREKPAAADALIKAINDGALIVNYMGHGNPTLWAHEHVFVQSRDLGRIEDSRKLPLYVAFTCDWAYFDDPASQSFPEQLLIVPDGGAIGAIASTRLTYSGSNFYIARNFFTNLFDERGMTPGEALSLAKHQAWGSSSPTYHLLGDPAWKIGAPEMSGEFTSLQPRPLPAQGVATAAGFAAKPSGEPDEAYNGETLFTLRDAGAAKRYVVVNAGPDTLVYTLPGATVYRGYFSLSEGRFAARFVVPKDVTLGGTLGRAVAYFHNDETDGIAYIDSVTFGDRVVVAADSTPPSVSIYFDHRGYRAGDPVSAEPLMIMDLADSSGLNLTGKMGHGISVAVDGGRPVNLTDGFRYRLDSHTEGTLEQRIGPFTPGSHDLRIEVWDAFNNLALIEQRIEVVASASGLTVDRVLNWPNPFNSTTALTFVVNRPVDYEIAIFTVNGRKIRTIRGSANSPGLVTNAVWNGFDDYGRQAGNGVYLFKVIAEDANGGKAEGLGRMAYLR